MDNEVVYFDPKTGNAKPFPPGKNPAGWKRVKNPDEIFIMYYPHPCKYLINNDGMVAVIFPPECDKVFTGEWMPLNYSYFNTPEEPEVKKEFDYYWDPKTNKYYSNPIKGKKLKKIKVTLRDGGKFITYDPPWMGPKLYINPETGENQWIPNNKKPPKGWVKIDFEEDDSTKSESDKEILREKRKYAIEKAAEGEGMIYIPQRDLANDDDYEKEMNRMGWQRSADGEWERMPLKKKAKKKGNVDGVNDLSMLEKMKYAISRMINSGQFTPDVIEKLKSLLSPEAIIVMAVLASIGGPFAVIAGGLLLFIGVGQDFFAFCDALSDMNKSENQAQLDLAVDKLEKSIIDLGIDAILVWLFARSVKGGKAKVEVKDTPGKNVPAKGAVIDETPASKGFWEEVFRKTFDVTEDDNGIKIETKPEFHPEEGSDEQGFFAEYEGKINKANKSLDVDYGAQTWYNKYGMRGMVRMFADLMIDELIKFAKKKGLNTVRLRRVASTSEGARLLNSLGFTPVSVNPETGVGLWEKVIQVS